MPPLSKQPVQVTLGLGLDQKTDAKLQMPGKLTTAENVRFSKSGRIDPRPGWAFSSTPPRKLQRLFSLGGQTMGVATPQAVGEAQMFYRADSQGVWRLVGDMPTVPRAIVRKTHSVPDVMFADSAINSNGNYMLIASIDSSAACTSTLIDNTTNVTLGKVAVASSVQCCRVVRHPTSATFLVVVNIHTAIKVYEIDPTQSTLSATLRMTISPTVFVILQQIDAISAPGNGLMYVAWSDKTGGASSDCDLVVSQIDPSSWTVTHSNREVGINGGPNTLTLAIPETTPARITVCASDQASDTYWFKQMNPANVSTTVTSKTTIDSIDGVNPGVCIIAIEHAADTSFPLKVVLEPNVGGVLTQKHFKIAPGGSVTTVLTNRALHIASRMCRVDSSRIMFWSHFYGTSYAQQSSFFLSEFGAQYAPRAMLASGLTVRKDTASSFPGDFPSLHQSSTNVFRSMAILNGGIV